MIKTVMASKSRFGLSVLKKRSNSFRKPWIFAKAGQILLPLTALLYRTCYSVSRYLINDLYKIEHQKEKKVMRALVSIKENSDSKKHSKISTY